jgi:hypothetical protein
MSTTRTLAAALTIAVLGASGAQAQPADMHASTASAAAKAQPKQDLRSADARDAALNPRDAGEQARRALPGPPTWPSHAQVIAPTAKAAPVDSESGVDWLPIAIGAGISLVAMTGLVALNNRRVRRPRRARITA